MDALISILEEIKEQLVELNSKIDGMTSGGLYDLSDIVSSVDGIKGEEGYNLTDIHSDLGILNTAIDTLDTTLSFVQSDVSSIESTVLNG